MKPKVVIKKIGDVTIFASTRVMDIDYVDELKQIIPNLLDAGCRNFIFNFERTDIFCSTALGVMVTLKKMAQENGGDTRLCNVNYTLMQILENTHLNEMFRIYDTEKETLESFLDKKVLS